MQAPEEARAGGGASRGWPPTPVPHRATKECSQVQGGALAGCEELCSEVPRITGYP